MSEEDLQTEARVAPPPYKARRSTRVPWVGIGMLIAALIVIGALVWWYTNNQRGELSDAIPAPTLKAQTETQASEPPATKDRDATTPIPSPHTPEASPVEAPQPPLPDLHESDTFIREQTSAWALPDEITSQADLVSRFSVLVVNAADGLVPTRLLLPFAPKQPFTVHQVGERYFLDPESYRRYDAYLTVLERISPDSVATVLDISAPLLTSALAEMGDTREPQALIKAAIERLNSLPNPGTEIELVAHEAVYQFADPRLENLPEIDRQLLRLGPDNLKRLKSWAQRFTAASSAR